MSVLSLLLLWRELFSKSPTPQKKLISETFKDNRSLGHQFCSTKVNNIFLKSGPTRQIIQVTLHQKEKRAGVWGVVPPPTHPSFLFFS